MDKNPGLMAKTSNLCHVGGFEQAPAHIEQHVGVARAKGHWDGHRLHLMWLGERNYFLSRGSLSVPTMNNMFRSSLEKCSKKNLLVDSKLNFSYDYMAHWIGM